MIRWLRARLRRLFCRHDWQEILSADAWGGVTWRCAKCGDTCKAWEGR